MLSAMYWVRLFGVALVLFTIMLVDSNNNLVARLGFSNDVVPLSLLAAFGISFLALSWNSKHLITFGIAVLLANIPDLAFLIGIPDPDIAAGLMIALMLPPFFEHRFNR